MMFIREKCGFSSPEIVFFSISKKNTSRHAGSDVSGTQRKWKTPISGPKWPNFDHFWSKYGQFVYGKKTKNFNFNYTNRISTKEIKK